MQINGYNNNQQKLGFGKVMKIRVFIDDLQTVDEKKIAKATRQLVKILQKQDLTHPNGDAFIKTFKEKVPDYFAPVGKVDPGTPIIRNLIDSTRQFLFTGPQVSELNPLGREIGKAKGKSLERVGTTNTYETRVSSDNYSNKIESFIKNPKMRLREQGDNGKELELNIYTTGKGNPKSDRFKLILNGIMFRKQPS